MSLSLSDYGLAKNVYQDFCPEQDEVTIRRPEHGKNLQLRLNGRSYEVSRVASAFPLSGAMESVVFFDSAGKEIGCLRRTTTLDRDSQELLKAELEKAYFMPRIRAVLAMEESLGVELWRVVTDKGEREFQVRGPRQNVRHMGQRRILIKDVDGNRYEIPNWEALDRKSTYLLMRHL